MALSELHSIFERQVGSFFTIDILISVTLPLSISLIGSFGQLFRMSLLHRRVLMRFNLLQQKFDLPVSFHD